MPILVRHQHREGLALAVLGHLVRCDLRQDRLRVTRGFLGTREVYAFVVPKRLAVMDIEEVARHTALHAQQAGAHEVSQARKAVGIAAMHCIIAAVPTKCLTNG